MVDDGYVLLLYVPPRVLAIPFVHGHASTAFEGDRAPAWQLLVIQSGKAPCHGLPYKECGSGREISCPSKVGSVTVPCGGRHSRLVPPSPEVCKMMGNPFRKVRHPPPLSNSNYRQRCCRKLVRRRDGCMDGWNCPCGSAGNSLK